MKRNAVILLSGGLDSCVAAAIARERGFALHAVSFDYGQRHRRELAGAEAVGRALEVASHHVFNIDLGQVGGSALTDRAIDVPTGRSEEEMASGVPVTYVPARNTIFLSFAVAVAEVKGADAIFIGAHAVDYSGYPDCRPEYFEAYARMANLATKRGVEGNPITIEVPLQKMGKADIVREGLRLKAPLHLTWSCYAGGERACGECDSCRLRLKGFREAGVEDAIPYEAPRQIARS